MRLATEKDVLDRMNLSQMSSPGTNTVSSVRSALDGATSHIESILRTPIQYSTKIDYFSVGYSGYSGSVGYDLWLSQRYVQGDVIFYTSPTNNVPIRDIEDAEVLDPKNYIVNRDMGRITCIINTVTGPGVIAVKYTAGFKESAANIPSWMRNAAIEAAVAINHTQSISHSKKDHKEAARLQIGALYSTLNEHIVTVYAGYSPDRTDVVVA